ncbi:hypothetical protein N0V83_009664 [Neocucurbitaria cava]|uniref:TauD/TfdA-like domain-containing protein n=1 Tax=Neocucurbitaria cava TaxID=798079 RepID=A0A9W9CHW5_9PLEO|nr:hypothetical protein N0V83_009664 [Neocucurbitaria cava]
MANSIQEKGNVDTTGSDFKTIRVKELHPTFGAEIEGVDFLSPSDEQFEEVLRAMAKYGFCVFRKTGMDDAAHVEFSRRLGDLDDIRPYITSGRKMRYEYYELFDAGNVDDDGNVIDPNSPKAQAMRFSTSTALSTHDEHLILFFARSSFPHLAMGGNTDFADSRTAFDELPEPLKDEVLKNDYVAAHSLSHSRKKAAPDFFKDVDVNSQPMYLHKLAQLHEPSKRMNLYVAAHAHHVEDVSKERSDQLLETLLEHITQEKYRTSVAWENVGDMIIWDNTSTAWGLNDPGSSKRPGFDMDRSNDLRAPSIQPQQVQPIAL